MDKEKGSEFSIGYKKPPRQTQFKPGKSGNPRGRPKKRVSFAESIEKELNTRITVHEGGKQLQIAKREAIAKQQTNKALQGDPKATALVMRAVEPRELEAGDNLSRLLDEMRAIHAKHQPVNFDMASNAGNDRNDAPNED